MSRPRGAALPGFIPGFCSTCLDESVYLRPTYATTWGGMTTVRWLYWTCHEGGDMATLGTFEVREPDETGLHPGVSWRKHGAHS